MPIRRSPNGAGHTRPQPRSPGMGGRDQSERPVAINWNRWSQSAGTRSQCQNSCNRQPLPKKIGDVAHLLEQRPKKSPTSQF
jgi:hypothetical protein